MSFTKGCYVGQENTARMHHRSKVNRRLVVVPTTETNDRTRIVYPELGLAVEHRRGGGDRGRIDAGMAGASDRHGRVGGWSG